MKEKFKNKVIVATCFYLLSFSIANASNDLILERLTDILIKGLIMLSLIVCSLLLIEKARLNWTFKLILVVWTFYTPLVYINDPKPYSFNMRERLGDLIIHPYGWIIITFLLIILIGVNKFYDYSERKKEN